MQHKGPILKSNDEQRLLAKEAIVIMSMFFILQFQSGGWALKKTNTVSTFFLIFDYSKQNCGSKKLWGYVISAYTPDQHMWSHCGQVVDPSSISRAPKQRRSDAYIKIISLSVIDSHWLFLREKNMQSAGCTVGDSPLTFEGLMATQNHEWPIGCREWAITANISNWLNHYMVQSHWFILMSNDDSKK